MDYQLPERYRLDPDPVLGEGGMGRVLRARDVILDMPVAIKVVRPDLAADVRFRKLFDLEVRISARFTHPHIVPLHDLGELGDGTPYLGLALADAGSFARLREEVPTWEEVLRLSLELLDALSHLHARGVLHRDLKPENVLLWTGEDEKPHVWLADLGLANASSSLAKKKGRREGTPGFMATEQHLGLPREYGPWTDFYPLGVMLWEIVTGELPFPLDKSAVDADLPPLTPRPGMEVPADLELVLTNCLAAEPMSRYDLAADLRTELMALGTETVKGGVRVRDPGASTGRRFGTVAPAAPPPTPTSMGFDDEPAEIVSTSDVFGKVPAWNRPKPPPIPPSVESECGFGATARASLKLFAVRELPLVARDEVRQQLWEQARYVQETGMARVCLVVGEAGSGKTRLVDSVARELEEGGWAEGVHLTYQESPGQEDGYGGAARALIKPWNETRASLVSRLRRRLGRAWGLMDDQVREEADKLARWCGLLEEDEEPVADGYGLREVYRFLEARSWRGLSYLVIDDVQWAVEEGDGLAIADAILQATSDGEQRKMLVLITIREEDMGAGMPLAKRVEAMVEQGAIRIDLPRLDRKGTEALLAESLTLAPDLAKRVVDRCEGNPLFARQLLIEWADRGWLVDTGGLQFGLAPGVDADAVMPADAEALFASRVEALMEASGNARRFRDALHMSALAGIVMPRELLMALVGQDEALQAFVRGCGLWVERGDLAKFDHGLLHQSVVGHARARKDASYLHRRLAKAWAKYGEDTGANIHFDCGKHAHAGRYYKFALEHLLPAAEGAWQRGRSIQLEAASSLAVDCCANDDKLVEKQGWAALWHARAAQVRGEGKDAEERFVKAFRTFESQNETPGVIESLVGLGWAKRISGEFADSEKTLADAMQQARQAGDLRLEADAISGMAWLEQQKRNFDGADILFTRVLNRYTQLDDSRGMGEAALGQAFVARRTGEFDDADDLYDEAIEAFQAGDDLLGVARARYGKAGLERQRTNLESSEKLYRDAIATAEDLGATQLLMECRVGLGELYRLRGEMDRARAIYDKHARWATAQGNLEALLFAHIGRAILELEDNNMKGAYDHANLAATELAKVPGHWLWATYRLVVASLLADRGDEDQTYRWLWSASELGLADTVDRDTAHLLGRIVDKASDHAWVNVMKVAGKTLTRLWEMLDEQDKADRVRKQYQALVQTAEGGSRPRR